MRYPDIAVYGGRDDPADDDGKAFDDPRVLFEILSSGTARTDLRVKLPEYKALPSVDTIVFVDIATERVHIVQRTGASSWNETIHHEPATIALPSLNVELAHDAVFARD